MVATEMSERIQGILDRISEAARRSGRDARDVTLLAVINYYFFSSIRPFCNKFFLYFI